MGQGKGSALVVVVTILCLMAIIEPTLGRTTYNINWTFNVNGWPRGKSFRAGDVLGKFFFILFGNPFIFFFFVLHHSYYEYILMFLVWILEVNHIYEVMDCS